MKTNEPKDPNLPPPPILTRCLVVNGPRGLSDRTVDEICDLVTEIEPELSRLIKEKLAEHGLFNITVTIG